MSLGGRGIGRFLSVAGLTVLLGGEIGSGTDLRVEAGRRTGGSKIAAAKDRGIIEKRSNHSVDETVHRLQGLLESKGVTLFALIDHSGEAAKVGLTMPPTKLLIFGNPKAGTPLMLAAPTAALDLPLKILVRADAQGQTWISYNSPAFLAERHGLPPELLAPIAAVEMLATKAAE
jgi:uncharacterized protein (DUF302 family)